MRVTERDVMKVTEAVGGETDMWFCEERDNRFRAALK